MKVKQKPDTPAYIWFIKGHNIALVIALVFLMLAGITSFLFYGHYRATLAKLLEEDRTTANLLSLVIEGHLNKIVKTMESYTSRPLLLKAVRERNAGKAKIHLANMIKTNPYIDIILISDRHGTLWASYPKRPEVHGKSFAYRDWYRGVSRDWQPYVSNVVMRVVGERDAAVHIAVPFLDERGEVLGILINTQRAVELGAYIQRVPLEPGSAISVTDGKGMMVYSSRYTIGKELTPYPFFSVIDTSKTGKNRSFAVPDPLSGRRSKYVTFAPVTGIGWYVFVGRDSRTILLSDWAHYLQMAAISLLLFLMTSISLVYFRKRVIAQKAIDQLAAERQLRESESRFRELFDTMSSGVAVYRAAENGDDFIITDLNAAGRRITGVNAGTDLIGKSVCEVFPGVREMGLFEVFQKVWRTGRVEFHPSSLYRNGRLEFWAENHVYKLPSGEIVAVFDDITDRKKAEDKIRRLNEGLERTVAQRTTQLEVANKELEAFCYSVSHDLRSPLRAIDGFSQALLEDYNDRVDDQGRDYLVRVRTASQNMAQLIDDLLMLSRISRVEVREETIDLSALARSKFKELRDENPGRVVDLAVQEEVMAQGDPNLLGIAMTNLLGNAYKFTRNNPHARIEFGAVTHEGKYAYFVRDNGVGFDMKYADKLFGAFQRLHSKSEFEGTGIGLATVARIIHKHGGRIWAEAEVGKGTTFYFTL